MRFLPSGKCPAGVTRPGPAVPAACPAHCGHHRADAGDPIRRGGPGSRARHRRARPGVTAAAESAYVVVTDRNGIRFSHPDPALISQKLEDPGAVLDGKTHVGFNQGSLGTSANAKAPIFMTTAR
ncbi:hypothetical protein [Pseudarthrobacter sp. TAF60_1]|uniref:hypothetical protein n=1 Tax=Pseudarthrobacter sp. TAF60_1 TaxID=3233071 RepID=UPI003F977BE2